MKLLVVLLAAAISSAASDCEVCLHEKCLNPGIFFDNRNDIDATRTSVSYNDNVMYYRDGATIKAIDLDDNTATPVPTLVPNVLNMGADVVTGELFYYMHAQKKVYKYNFESNETSVIDIPEPDKKKLNPYSTWAYNGKLYFNRQKERSFDVENGLNFVSGPTVQRVSALENINVKDVVFAESGNMFITDDTKIYKLKTNQELKVLEAPITPDELQMSGSQNGDLYVFNTKKNLIYMLDPITEKFKQVGGFLNPKYVNYASLDKNNNIIFRNHKSLFYYKASSDRCIVNVEDGWNFRLSISKV